MSRVYIGLGDKMLAFEWSEKDFQAHSSTLPAWIFIPTLDSLRDDSRFKDLRKRMNLPE